MLSIRELQVPVWKTFCEICRYQEWFLFVPGILKHVPDRWSPCHFTCLRRYDYIEIRDGDSEAADLLGKHCGNIAPPTIISSGPSLYIKFTSDYARQGAGFSLRYEIYKTGECLIQCLSPRLTQLSLSVEAFGHLFNVISSIFSGDKGLFFKVKQVCVSHFQEGKDLSGT